MATNLIFELQANGIHEVSLFQSCDFEESLDCACGKGSFDIKVTISGIYNM